MPVFFFSKTKSETHYLKKIFSLCLQIAPIDQTDVQGMYDWKKTNQ